MFKQIKSLSLIVVFVLGVMSLSGCFAVLVGAAAGASGYAWANGALIKEFDATATELYEASIDGLKNLNLVIISDQHDRLTARIHSEFSDGKGIAINIDALTERTSRIKIRVGLFGDKLRSELLFNSIKKYM